MMLFALIFFSWKQIFGVSGQNIDQIRNYTGATVTALAQNQLPLCASAHESDRVVQPKLDMHLPFLTWKLSKKSSMIFVKTNALLVTEKDIAVNKAREAVSLKMLRRRWKT